MNPLANSPTQPELNRLLAALCGGELVATDQQGLILLLQQSVEARETYVRYMSVHAELMWRFVGKHPAVPQDGAVLQEGKVPQNGTAPRDAAALSRGVPLVGPATSAEPPASQPAPSAWLGFLADAVGVIPGGDVVVGGLVILAVVGALCGVAFYIHSSRPVEVAGQLSTNNFAAATKSVAATGPPVEPGTRVGSVQTDLLATWSREAASPAGGAARVGRRYDLTSGRAEIALTSGARLVIGGPAVWQLDSEQRLSLGRGQVLVYVPAAAQGFTVITPTAEIMDLGTEFVVEVGEAEETRVAVVRGSVQLATLVPAAAQLPASSRPALLVSAGHAMTVSGKDARRAVAATTNFDAEWVQRIARLGQSSVVNEVIAFQALPTGLGGNHPGGTAMGNDFEVREPIRMFSLGVFDSLGDGIDPSTTLTVKLWAIDDHGTPHDPQHFTGKQVLAERTFSADSPGMLRGCFRFKPLPEPMDLQPGFYSVVVDGFSQQNACFDSNYGFAAPQQQDVRAEFEVATSRYAILQRGPRYANQPTPGVFPDVAESSGNYLAGSFTYAPLEASK